MVVGQWGGDYCVGGVVVGDSDYWNLVILWVDLVVYYIVGVGWFFELC